MAGEDEVTMVPNAYKNALETARTRSMSPADDIKEALDKADRAMSAGCWVSTTADDFGSALSEHKRTLGTVRDKVIEDFDDAIAGQPERVESTAWQTRWQKMAGTY
ncbi:MAG: hypothetical protein DI571_12070 [Arsenicicoccus sp.]|nr:MAG: hypothetical protein DI571_12070 [Arsenicicoccus sp.]